MAKRLAVALVSGALLSTGGVATAAVLRADPPPKQPAAVERVSQYTRLGPSATYGSDYGGIGEAKPLVFDVTQPDAQTGVVEASFSYRTRGPGPFTMALRVKAVGGDPVAVRPGAVVLASAPDGDVSVARFLVRDLQPGVTYEAHLGVNSRTVQGGQNVIRTKKVLLTVDLH